MRAIFHRLSHELSRELLPLVNLYFGAIVSRNVLTLRIPSPFVIAIVAIYSYTLDLRPHMISLFPNSGRISAAAAVGLPPVADAHPTIDLRIIITPIIPPPPNTTFTAATPPHHLVIISTNTTTPLSSSLQPTTTVATPTTATLTILTSPPPLKHP
ncbi:hypothetical protein Tco_1530341 [Tanacetum coccineum]